MRLLNMMRDIFILGITVLMAFGVWLVFNLPNNNTDIHHVEHKLQFKPYSNKVNRTKEHNVMLNSGKMSLLGQYNNNIYTSPFYNNTFWKYVRAQETRDHLYSHNTRVDEILHALSSSEIVDVRLFSPGDVTKSTDVIHDYGSTHKWIITLKGGQKAIFKPKW